MAGGRNVQQNDIEVWKYGSHVGRGRVRNVAHRNIVSMCFHDFPYG
ncbi:MAG TPA: hypothetical protein VFK06_25020 [Candidatus Angelobacter sp.]|nr:hypothetical protein [Candidatus Angelobacter sp.]